MLMPPQTYEVLPAAKTLLETAGVIADMGGFGAVIVAEGDVVNVAIPTASDDGFWWRIVLMEKINGMKDPDEHTDKVRGYPFRVRIDLNPPNTAVFDPQHFLEGAHQKVYATLHMKQVTLTKATLVYQIIRKTVPTAMFRDTDQGWRYMSAGYLTVLGPT